MKRSLLIIATLLTLSLSSTIFLAKPAFAGHTLTDAQRGPGYWYTVQTGDSWYGLAVRLGVPVSDLWRVNPEHIRWNYWLITGERLWIPQPVGSCPGIFADYPAQVVNQLNGGSSANDLRNWLNGCGVLDNEATSFGQYALAGVVAQDYVIKIDETPADPMSSSTLLALHKVGGSYQIAHQVDSSGEKIRVVSVADLNLDGMRELVWTGTMCGAHTCVGNLHVEQWNGTNYADWIIGTPSMPTATYSLSDTVPGTSGTEIVVHGGAIGSAGAGPIRQWTEVYHAPAGQPYQLYQKTNDPTTCYYHRLLDVNTIFDLADAPESGGYLYPVSEYTTLLNDASLNLDDCPYAYPAETLTNLKDFTRLRLVISHSESGGAAQATTARNAITTPIIQGAADAFLAAYSGSGDLAAACNDVTTYAIANPTSWNYLEDWGYGNPTFKAEWLCHGTARIDGVVWNDYCPAPLMFPPNPNAGCTAAYKGNGLWEAGEVGIADVTVTLYKSTCAALGSVERTATTEAFGNYTFDMLDSGNYCVEVDAASTVNSTILIPGEWTQPDAEAVAHIDISVAPGSNHFFNNDFGWDYQFD